MRRGGALPRINSLAILVAYLLIAFMGLAVKEVSDKDDRMLEAQQRLTTNNQQFVLCRLIESKQDTMAYVRAELTDGKGESIETPAEDMAARELIFDYTKAIKKIRARTTTPCPIQRDTGGDVVRFNRDESRKP